MRESLSQVNRSRRGKERGIFRLNGKHPKGEKDESEAERIERLATVVT